MIEDAYKTNIKAAVILFNLGGPGSLEEVEPFLFNLFYDKRIITLPKIPRFLIAKMISKLRKHKATEIYQELGGKSPIGENTYHQTQQLQEYLINHYPTVGDINISWRVMYAMRHSTPRLAEILPMIDDFNPQNLILLPLYPQYSTTTTESFFDEFKELMPEYKSNTKITPVYEYYNNPEYIQACGSLILEYIKNNDINMAGFRLLFSAHGLPKSIVKAGDPYQKQTEECARLILENIKPKLGEIDSMVCYQSKVGPKKWLEPSLNDSIALAGKQKRNVIIFPISFTSEHSETLVELDIETRDIAKECGVERYFRIPTLGHRRDYVACLANICKNILAKS